MHSFASLATDVEENFFFYIELNLLVSKNSAVSTVGQLFCP